MLREVHQDIIFAGILDLDIKRLHLLNSSSDSGFHRLSFHCSYSDSTSHKNTRIPYSEYKMASLVKLFI